jgi:hypothetical protein
MGTVLSRSRGIPPSHLPSERNPRDPVLLDSLSTLLSPHPPRDQRDVEKPIPGFEAGMYGVAELQHELDLLIPD